MAEKSTLIHSYEHAHYSCNVRPYQGAFLSAFKDASDIL